MGATEVAVFCIRPDPRPQSNHAAVLPLQLHHSIRWRTHDQTTFISCRGRSSSKMGSTISPMGTAFTHLPPWSIRISWKHLLCPDYLLVEPSVHRTGNAQLIAASLVFRRRRSSTSPTSSTS